MTKAEMEKCTTLDTNQCKWWVNHLFNIAKETAFNANAMDDAKEIQSAQDKIIKVLEQEPCEDAISRADANKLVDELARAIDDQNRHYPKRGRDIAIIARDIERLPRVTPIREHGEWIKVTNGRGGHECSQCGNYAPSYQNGAEHLSDFCPKCGADMRKEQNNG